MLESIVSNILNRLLGAYCENLNTNQLNIGIWSGDVKLRNLRLKREALDKFHLPISCKDGYIGELTASIPWSNLRGKPVQVTIKDIYVLCEPSAAQEIDDEELERRDQAAKREKLEAAELLTSKPSAGLSEEEQQKNESFASSLTTKIVDNLQVTVQNIHIRYEDKLSCPGHPFAVGLSLAEFTANSTDENWKPAFIQDSRSTIHKLAKLNSLAFYWDTDCQLLSELPRDETFALFAQLIARSHEKVPQHQFILKPVSGEGRLLLNKTANAKTPLTDGTLFFQELGFVFDEDQYRDALLMVGLFHFYLRQQQYRKFRKGIEASGARDTDEEGKRKRKARALLRFAFDAILNEVHEKHRQWTWDYLKERRDDRKKYVTLFKRKATQTISPSDALNLEDLEWKLSYEDIRFYRSIARSELRKERAAAKLTTEQQSLRAGQAQSSWFGWMWGGGQTSQTDQPQSILSEEQRKELYKAIEWDESDDHTAAFQVAQDAIKLKLTAKLKTGSFSLRHDPHGMNHDLISLVYDTVQANLVQRPENFEFDLSLGGLRVYDGSTEDSLYPQIVRVKYSESDLKDDRNEFHDHEEAKLAVSHETNEADPFFYLKFENNPLDERADTGLTLRMRAMEIYYSAIYIEAIVKFFEPPPSQLESINALVEVAGSTIEGIRSQTRAGLEYALAKHKTLDVQMDLAAPLIIIPENCTSRDCTVMVLDAGHIAITSDLVKKDALQKIHAKSKEAYTEDDYKRLESVMYDRFDVRLQDAQVVMNRSVADCLMALRSSEASRSHILDKTSLSFKVENSILSSATNLTRFRISGHLPLLHVNLSDRKYKGLMQLIDVAIPKFSKDDREALTASASPSAHGEEAGPSRMGILASRIFGDQGYEVDHSDSSSTSSSLGDDDEDRTNFEDAIDGSTDDKGSSWRQKIFEFTFQVDELRASLLQAERDGFTERLLADTVLRHFMISFHMRQYDMSAEVILRSLFVEDKMTDQQSQFKHMVTSDDLDKSEASKELVHIVFSKVQAQSPEYMSVYEGIDTQVDVQLSTLSIIVTRSSVLDLFNFVMTTFTEQGNPQLAQLETEAATDDTATAAPDSIPESTVEGKMRVKVKLTSIALVLNNDGVRLATLKMSQADVAVMMTSGSMRVGARLGSLSLTDDAARVSTHDVYRNLLTLKGDELADFRYETFSKGKEGYPGYDASVYLRTGSLEFTFVEEAVRDLLQYLRKFAQMKAVYDQASRAASEQASQLQESLQESGSKFKYDVLVRTPIIVCPRTSMSRDVIRAYLGEIYAQNEFVEDVNCDFTTISTGLRSIRLISESIENDQMHELEMISDVHIELNVRQLAKAAQHGQPDITVTAKMSDLKMNLTETQYCIIMNLSKSIPAVFAMPDEDEQQALHEAGGQTTAKQLVRSPSSDVRQGEESAVPVDLLPELRTHSHDSEGNTSVWTSTSLTFSVDQIYLELFAGTASKPTSLREGRLMKFCLSKTGVTYKMLSDGAMEAEVKVQSFTVHDTRPGQKNRFREIIPAIDHDNPQFTVSYTQTGGLAKNAVALISIDTPRIIFALDPIFALRNFVLSAFAGSDTSSPSEEAAPPPDPSSAKEATVASTSNESLSYRVSIVDASIILLARPENQDTEAMVLSTKQILMSQQGILALKVNQLGMFLCRMNQPLEHLRFLDNFDLTVALDSRPRDGRPVAQIEIDIDPLVFRVSYRDVMLMISILNKASELSAVKTIAVEGRSQSVALTATKTDQIIQKDKVPSRAHARAVSRTVEESQRRQSRLVEIKKVDPLEELKVNVQGLELIIIGDMHELPMLDLVTESFKAEAFDWSSDIKMKAMLSSRINWYNLTNSHWEPVMDPWQFSISATKSLKPECLNLKLTSPKRVEFNLSHSLVEWALNTATLISSQGQEVLNTERGRNAPFVFQNRTGYNLFVWTEEEKKGQKPELQRLADGQRMPWRFADWRKMREVVTEQHNTVGLQFEGIAWESIRRISVDSQGEFLYHLRPKIENVTHRLMIDVKLQDNVKVVTFRSSVIVENKTLIPVEVVVIDNKGKAASSVYKVAPDGECPVPIEAAYHDRIKIRPDPGFGYHWSVDSLHWQDLVKSNSKTISCRANESTDAPFRFQVHAKFDKRKPLAKVYPCMAIRLCAPIDVQNLLPHDIKFRIYDKNTKQDWSNFLRKGGTSPIHVVELSHLLLMSIEIQDTVFKPSEFAIINTYDPEEFRIEDKIVLTDPDGTKLHLRLHYHEHPDCGGAFKVVIYSPYVMINKTGLDVVIKSKSFMSQARVAAGQGQLGRDRKKRLTTPFMFSYASEDRGNRTVLRAGDSDWSRPLSFEAVPSEIEVVLPSRSPKEEYRLGVMITQGLGDYKLTKVIEVRPRILFRNALDEDIQVCQEPNGTIMRVSSGQRSSLYCVPVRKERVASISLSDTGANAQWTAPLAYTEIGKSHLRIMTKDDKERLIRVDTAIEKASIFVKLSWETEEWPFLVRNESDYAITICQSDEIRSFQGEEELIERISRRKYKVEPHTTSKYAWDYPAGQRKQLRVRAGRKDRDIDVLEIGDLVPFRFSTDNGIQILSIDVTAKGSTQILTLANYNQSLSIYKPKCGNDLQRLDSSASQSSVQQSAFDTVNVENHSTMRIQLAIEGLGISVINKRLQELAYVSLEGLQLSIDDSPLYQSVNFICRWIQIDNQLYGGLYPIILYPSTIKKEVKELEAHPSVHASVIRAKDEVHGVQYFKYASILLQEMSLEIDEDFLFALFDFLKIKGANFDPIDSKLIDEPVELPDPVPPEGGVEMYFEVLHIQPIKLNLSFVRTDRVNVEDKLETRTPVTFFLNALTMALGNINDAPVTLNALVVENMRASTSLLQERITRHYAQEFFYQLHRVLGSADFLGNPVGLFNNVSSGVIDIFYEPYQGYVMSDRPGELGLGLARGATSFVKKTVFGFTDSFSKVTASIGKGLSAATMDKTFQDRRRLSRVRNKPKHALYGITSGASSFATSVASGFEGLARKPMEGAEAGGTTGFFKGVGKGVVGAFTKPAVGFFDLASNVAEGVRNSTTMYNDTLDRVRLPRFIGEDKVLRPYNETEALGKKWLTEVDNGAHFDDQYLAHIELPGDDNVCILTPAQLLLVRVRRMRTDWEVSFTDLQTISLEPTGIALVMRGGVQGPFLPISVQSNRQAFFRKIDTVVRSYNAARRALD